MAREGGTGRERETAGRGGAGRGANLVGADDGAHAGHHAERPDELPGHEVLDGGAGLLAHVEVDAAGPAVLDHKGGLGPARGRGSGGCRVGLRRHKRTRRKRPRGCDCVQIRTPGACPKS